MDWLRAALTVLGGAVAGGLTNRVAIWMLFHPHQPPTVLGMRLGWLQGAVPKNRRRLARSIGDTVGSRLLTPDDLAAALRDEGLREAFQAQLHDAVLDLLARQHPAPAEWLPPTAAQELRSALEEVLGGLRPRLADLLESQAFARGVREALEEAAVPLDRAGPGTGPGDEDGPGTALRRQAEAWMDRMVASESFEAAVRRQVDRAARRLLRPGRSLGDVLPEQLSDALESSVSAYLPLLLERVGRLLEDPDARTRFRVAVDDLLQRFMRDLRFHQRVVARLVITEETVSRVVDTVRDEGAERLGELLREPEVQQAVARGVRDAVAELLARPAREVLAPPDDPRARRAVERTSRWIVDTLRSPGVRDFLLDRLEETVRERGGATWAELVGRLPAERVGGWAASFLRSAPGRRLSDHAARKLAPALLERPLALHRVVDRDTARRLADTLAPRLWGWVAGEVPGLTARIPVAQRVREKILAFPLDQLEGLVRSVTQRELTLIVRLGYLLGAVVGGILVAATALVS